MTVGSRKVKVRSPAVIKAEADEHLRRVLAITGPLKRRNPRDPALARHEAAVRAHPAALPHWEATKAAWWEMALGQQRVAMSVARLAERTAPVRFGRGDMESTAWLGVFYAAGTWNPALTSSFGRYAFHYSWGMCRRSMTQGQPVHTSNSDTYRRISLSKWLAEGYSFADAAERAGMDVVSAGLLYSLSGQPVMMDAPFGNDPEGPKRLGDVVAAPAVGGVDERISLDAALMTLPEQDRVWFGNVLHGMGVFDGARAAGYHVSEQRITERWIRLKQTIRVKLGLDAPPQRFSTVDAVWFCQQRPRTTREIAEELGTTIEATRRALHASSKFYRNGEYWEVDDE